MSPNDYSLHRRTTAETRELAELMHKHRKEIIQEESIAKRNEIHDKANAQIKVDTHQAGLLADLFQRKAEIDAAAESHHTHEIGKRLGMLQHHESLMTREQAKRHHQNIQASKAEAKIADASEVRKTNEIRKRTIYQMEASRVTMGHVSDTITTIGSTARTIMSDALKFKVLNSLPIASQERTGIQMEELPRITELPSDEEANKKDKK